MPALSTQRGLAASNGNMTFFAISGNMNEYRERGIGLGTHAYGGRSPDTGGYQPNGQADSGPFILFEEEPGDAGAGVQSTPLPT